MGLDAPALRLLAGGGAAALLVLRVWTPTLRTPADYVAFLGTGLLAEELVYRGILYRLAARLWEEHDGRIGVVVGLGAVLFGLSHLQYHRFVPSPAALTQVAYTIGMGVVRRRTGSLWPAIALHLLTNLLTVLRQ